MPTIKDFGSFRISMYFEDHNPPHVHVIGPGFYALVAIADARILRGAIPARHRKRAQKWMAENQQALFELWDQYQ
jgi:hypothetical protein